MIKAAVISLSFLLLLLLQACSHRSESETLFSAGQKAYAAQNYHQAFKQVYAAALLGNPDAEYALGYLYYNGFGTNRDQSAALHWFKQAAKHKQADALEALRRLDYAATQQTYNLT